MLVVNLVPGMVAGEQGYLRRYIHGRYHQKIRQKFTRFFDIGLVNSLVGGSIFCKIIGLATRLEGTNEVYGGVLACIREIREDTIQCTVYVVL